MKKTFTINISGSVFHIDEDAFDKLQNYLQMLSSHFGGNEEGREILQDIEARIAELFLEKMADGKDVINLNWVDDIIKRMGKPEDFMEGEEEEKSDKETQEAAEPVIKKIRRRLYRDPDNRVLGGVSSGMGAYFRIDPIIIRLIFVLLFFVLGPFNLLLYIVLWVAVPKARTTAQKLEMRGEEANVSNIEKSIREEVKEVKESYKKFVDSPSYEKGKDRLGSFGDMVYSVVKVLLRVLVLLIGVAFILGGFIAIISFVTSMVVGHSIVKDLPWAMWWTPGFSMPGIANHFMTSGSMTVLMIAITVLVGIPILTVLFIGTKLVFRYKTNNRAIGLGAFGAWLVALITIISLSLSQLGNYSQTTNKTITQKVKCNTCETLYLELADAEYQSYVDYKFNNMKIAVIDGEEKLLGRPKVDIDRSNTDKYSVIIRLKARGSNSEEALENIENIVYNIEEQDSMLMFDPYFSLSNDVKWRDQEVSVTVRVPEGKSVYLGNDMVDIIYDIKNIENMWDGHMIGKTWIMTSDGLTQKNKPINKKQANETFKKIK